MTDGIGLDITLMVTWAKELIYRDWLPGVNIDQRMSIQLKKHFGWYELSFPLNPIFLSRGDDIRRGGDGDLDDGRSELVVASFRGPTRASATLVF